MWITSYYLFIDKYNQKALWSPFLTKQSDILVAQAL